MKQFIPFRTIQVQKKLDVKKLFNVKVKKLDVKKLHECQKVIQREKIIISNGYTENV
jgi:hypothetical protein